MDNLLTDVLQLAFKNMMNNMHTCLPGEVKKYDHTIQKATVLPLIKKNYKDGKSQSLPLIVNVPVIWPRSSNASMTFPVNAGDGVLLLFSERALENWLALGGEQIPGDARKFDLTDAIAIPGLYPFSTPSLSENNTDVLIKYNSTTVRITQSGDVNIDTPTNVNINAGNNIAMTAGSQITMAAPLIGMSANGVTATINGGGNVSIDGPVVTTDTIDTPGDITSGGISLQTHVHSGVQSGGSNTGGPV
jgi:phage baseplate assembly protein gpV